MVFNSFTIISDTYPGNLQWFRLTTPSPGNFAHCVHGYFSSSLFSASPSNFFLFYRPFTDGINSPLRVSIEPISSAFCLRDGRLISLPICCNPLSRSSDHSRYYLCFHIPSHSLTLSTERLRAPSEPWECINSDGPAARPVRCAWPWIYDSVQQPNGWQILGMAPD